MFKVGKAFLFSFTVTLNAVSDRRASDIVICVGFKLGKKRYLFWIFWFTYSFMIVDFILYNKRIDIVLLGAVSFSKSA